MARNCVFQKIQLSLFNSVILVVYLFKVYHAVTLFLEHELRKHFPKLQFHLRSFTIFMVHNLTK